MPEIKYPQETMEEMNIIYLYNYWEFFSGGMHWRENFNEYDLTDEECYDHFCFSLEDVRQRHKDISILIKFLKKKNKSVKKKSPLQRLSKDQLIEMIEEKDTYNSNLAEEKRDWVAGCEREKEKNKLLTKRLDCVEKQLEVQLSNTVRAAKISDENILLKEQIDKQFHEIELIKNKLKEIIG